MVYFIVYCNTISVFLKEDRNKNPSFLLLAVEFYAHRSILGPISYSLQEAWIFMF